jgi:hypothetical protein
MQPALLRMWGKRQRGYLSVRLSVCRGLKSGTCSLRTFILTLGANTFGVGRCNQRAIRAIFQTATLFTKRLPRTY